VDLGRQAAAQAARATGSAVFLGVGGVLVHAEESIIWMVPS
jgi:hypothetical protein